MAVRCGTRFELQSFLTDPVWLAGEFSADLVRISAGLQAMIESPLLAHLMYLLCISTKVAMKALTHLPGAGTCRHDRFHDIGNMNYSICWRILCKAIITSASPSSGLLRTYLKYIVEKWQSVFPSRQGKSNQVMQGDMFEALFGVWRDTTLEEWQQCLGLSRDDAVLTSRTFHDGLFDLCAATERLMEVFKWTDREHWPTSNDAFAMIDRCQLVHANCVSAPSASGAKKLARRKQLYRHLCAGPLELDFP
jgi:hypothetical protein